MKVKLIEGTENPEELICKCARNDYRKDGIIGYSFDEIIEKVEPDNDHIQNVAQLFSLPQGDSSVKTEAKKRTLLDHLIDSGHWGPFEHPQATITIEGVTRVVTHQIVRHRHFTYDQQSLRYVNVGGLERNKLYKQFQFPKFINEGEVVSRTDGVTEIDSESVRNEYKGAYDWVQNSYQNLLDKGVPQEEARKVLPMGIKTNITMSGNSRAWMHILNVRTKANVQGETRECAERIFEELKEWMPYTFKKYDEDVLPLKLNP